MWKRRFFGTLLKSRFLRFALVILTLLLLAPAVLPAQSVEEIEELTVQVNTLLDRAERTANAPEKSTLAERALKISLDLHYDDGVLRASLLLAGMADRAGNTAKALEHYLEAEERLGNSMNRAQLLAVYRAIGDLFFRESLYSNARAYYDRILRKNPGDFDVMEKAGDAAVLEMRLDTAPAYYNVLVDKYLTAGNYGRVVQIKHKLAKAYEDVGDTANSLTFYEEIEKIVDQNGFPHERAVMYNNLGRQYARRGNHEKAVEYFHKAELQCGYISCDYMDAVYANLGVALSNIGRTQEAIAALNKAVAQLNTRKDRPGLANLEHLIATVYLNNRDIYNALAHNNTAIRLATDNKQREVLARAYKTQADLYFDLYDFEQALNFYQKYLELKETLRDEEHQLEQKRSEQRALLAAAENQIKFLIARQNANYADLQRSEYERQKIEADAGALQARADALESQKEADRIRLRAEVLKAEQARSKLQLIDQQLQVEKQERELARLHESQARQQADSLQRAQELELLRKDKNISDLRLDFQTKEQQAFRRYVYGLGLLGLIILGLVGGGYVYARRSARRLSEKNRRIQAQSALITEERQKSDKLLLNILPEEIAEELKTRGYASPRFYDSVTVLFTDFTNFTALSSRLTPEQLIDELNECFLAFDEICDKYNLEKIKTIGDAYMCAGGVPLPNETHPVDAVRAALDMVAWLDHRRQAGAGGTFFDMRIGIHTGPVVAGVVGKNKFAYDIWGDAVNLAARLEELGEPGRVNISGSTHEAVKHRYRCSFRGQKDVRNKGLVEMYFIEEELGEPAV